MHKKGYGYPESKIPQVKGLSPNFIVLSDKTCEKSFGTFETNSALILSDGSDQKQLAKDIMALPDIAGVSRLSVTGVCRLCKLPDETSGTEDQNGRITEGRGISLALRRQAHLQKKSVSSGFPVKHSFSYPFRISSALRISSAVGGCTPSSR